MTSVAESPSCPRCGETMVLRVAERGSYAGQRFWGCPRFPQCWGRRGVEPTSGVEPSPASAVQTSQARLESPAPRRIEAGQSAQVEFERRRGGHVRRLRRVWPVLVGFTLVLMLLAYLFVSTYISPEWGAGAAAVVVLVMLGAISAFPQVIDAWRVGAEGERRTAAYLDGLAEHGFVLLHDRKVPGYGGNLDHLAIGPSGVWVIETKSLRGKVEIEGDVLKIGGHRQDRIVDQVFREATSVQIALRQSLDGIGLTAIPALCLHRSRLPLLNRSVRGVRLASGADLTKLLRQGSPRLTAEQVQEVARAADRLLLRAAPRT